jgi:transcriptional regulator with XRE-family HTH domain
MRFSEIGQQLRAFRLESGLRAEEIAARLGVSRAALYRYEKGEVIKLDTVQRMAELLNLSPLTLLGVGIEYYTRPIGYFERVRQIEETTDQILEILGPLCFLITSDPFDTVLAQCFEETVTQAELGGGERGGIEPGMMRSQADQILGTLGARKRMYASRRPSIICMLPLSPLRRLLETGIAPGLALSDATRRRCQQIAAAEIRRMAELMETEPMGLQFGLLPGPEPTSCFTLLRARGRATLVINPFQPDTHPAGQTGVAMVTSADDAVSAHQRVAEASWRDALKGAAGAARLREILAERAQT